MRWQGAGTTRRSSSGQSQGGLPAAGADARRGAARPPGARRAGRALAGALAALVLCAAAASSGAVALKPPSAATGVAREVSYGSAVLSGSLDPNGSDTSYYFQYGLTKGIYGSQTAIADAGAGAREIGVSARLSGLAPLTVYHYRLVAVSAAGTVTGADRSFMTTKVPLSLSLLGAPNPVPFGGTIVLSGTLAGTGSANREVVLQANAFPFTAGFRDVGNPELTTAGGGFSFPVLGLTAVTQYRVAALTNPEVLSPVWLENVAVRISCHIAPTGRAHFARIYGTVTPAEPGAQVGFLRTVHGRGVLAGGTVVRPLNSSSSFFSRVVRVSRGVYRVLVRVSSGAQVSAYSAPLLIG